MPAPSSNRRPFNRPPGPISEPNERRCSQAVASQVPIISKPKVSKVTANVARESGASKIRIGQKGSAYHPYQQGEDNPHRIAPPGVFPLVG